MFMLLIIGQMITYTKTENVLITNIPPIERRIAAKETETNYNSYDHIIGHYCQLYNIDQELVKIIIERESNFNPRAVSKSGAVGLMQLMPRTADLLGVKDVYNPSENIRGGVKFLRNLFDMFGGDLELVLAAYHAGPGLVKKLNRVPSIPATIDYVDYIISKYGPVRRKIPIFFSLTKEGTPFFTNLPK